MIILGIDPALSTTGWGVVKVNGNAASFVAGGVVKTNAKDSHADRLKTIYNDMQEIISIYQPDQVAVEEVYVNDNARTSLKLGQARGVSLLVPSLHNIPVFEYTPTEIKKAIVGTGRAKKEQVQHMVKTLLPTAGFVTLDTSDALGVALCHFHIYSFKQKVS
ncbi:MAG: crossover junction endodeoxyribonuclease RuvC [Pseudomonadota bacterium]|nr:crossover junction endodeoxyribonuclease RuvC [Pseudomonadota bacterium]